METTPHVNRRKACDLCFTKKLRCDMLKPTCTNCTQYGAVCKTTTIRRQAGRQKSVTSPAINGEKHSVNEATGDVSGKTRIDGLESRLSRIEAQLQANSRLEAHSTTGDAPAGILSISSDDQRGIGHGRSLDSEKWVDTGEQVSRDFEPSHAPKLPPIDKVIPIVDIYFSHSNSVIPLFDQAEFMRMLNDWYSGVLRRSKAAWAAVNIVLALGSRIPTTGQELEIGVDGLTVRNYMTNAQSAVGELMTRDQDLIGLKVLLGLVLLYQESKDPRPATLLIGAAVRLIHRLRFQSRDEIEALYTPQEGLHRSRLFWITYMLDKEISLKHQTPSLQLDADVDLDLPPNNPTDGVGNIYTVDRGNRVNYFRLRVQLAHIQGRAYDLLYSTRSTKVSLQERQARVVRLSHQLEKWRLDIPPEMQQGSAVENMERMAVIPMSILHCSYLSCLVLVHGIWSHNASWIKRISSYGRNAIQDSEVEGRRCYNGAHGPLPTAWAKCLTESRECLNMVRKMRQSDIGIWGCCCAITSSLIIILANMYEVCTDGGQGHQDENDEELVLYATGLFNKFKSQSTMVSFQRLDAVIAELNGAVHLARHMVVGNTSPSFMQEVQQSSKPAGHWNGDKLFSEISSVEVFSHQVIKWGGEDGSELGVFASVFATEAGSKVGDETGEDESAWMGGEENYIFEDVNFEEVVSGFEFPPSLDTLQCLRNN